MADEPRLIEYEVSHKPNYFFALLPPPHVCGEIHHWGEVWREELNGDHVADWLPPEEYRVVVLCLGVMEDAQVPRALQAGSAAAARLIGRRLGFGEPAAWPNGHRPQHLAVRATGEAWHPVQAAVSSEVEAAGLPPGEAVSDEGCVVIAHCSPRVGKPLQTWLTRIKPQIPDFGLEELVLLQSVPAGPDQAGTRLVASFPIGRKQPAA